jgi:hypothetical protein
MLTLALHEGKWTASCLNQLTSMERAPSAHWNLLQVKVLKCNLLKTVAVWECQLHLNSSGISKLRQNPYHSCHGWISGVC